MQQERKVTPYAEDADRAVENMRANLELLLDASKFGRGYWTGAAGFTEGALRHFLGGSDLGVTKAVALSYALGYSPDQIMMEPREFRKLVSRGKARSLPAVLELGDISNPPSSVSSKRIKKKLGDSHTSYLSQIRRLTAEAGVMDTSQILTAPTKQAA